MTTELHSWRRALGAPPVLGHRDRLMLDVGPDDVGVVVSLTRR